LNLINCIFHLVYMASAGTMINTTNNTNNKEHQHSSSSSTGKVTDIKRLISQKFLDEFDTVPKMKKELIALCQSSSNISISTDGGLDDLKRKYRNFIAFHNAQLESSNPFTFAECVQEINRAERARASESWNSGPTNAKFENSTIGEVRL